MGEANGYYHTKLLLILSKYLSSNSCPIYPPVWNRVYNSRFFFFTRPTINVTRYLSHTHTHTHSHTLTHTHSCCTAIKTRDDCKCFTSRLPWSLLAATTRARKSLARTLFPSGPVACESLLGRSQVSTTLTLTLPILLVAKVARPFGVTTAGRTSYS